MGKMNPLKVEIAKQLVQAATVAVEAKAKLVRREINRKVSMKVHHLLSEQVEREMQKVLEPFFREQIKSIVSRLGRMEGKSYLKGGAGSGNFGHEGRPGEVGGSGAVGSGGDVNSKVESWATQKFGSAEKGKAFAKWFGQSNVVDEEGNPKVVYHGTRTDFNKFDLSKFGQFDEGWLGEGFYFADTYKAANSYANPYDQNEGRRLTGGVIKPVFLSLQNPIVVDFNAKNDSAKKFNEARGSMSAHEFTNHLKSQGHDGVIFLGPKLPSGGRDIQFMAFNSTQIKSATGNRGTFDPKDPDVRKSVKSMSVVIPVPDIRQPDRFSCGACCAMSVGRHFGVGPETLDEWKKALGTSLEKSTSPMAIANYLAELGLRVWAQGGMTINDLDRYTKGGWPVICPVQDYAGVREPGASWDYGHWLVVCGVVDGHLICQDSSIENLQRKPGGGVSKEDEDDCGNIAAPGKVLIREQDWMDAWHDVGEDGTEYLQYGIAVGPGVTGIVDRRASDG